MQEDKSLDALINPGDSTSMFFNFESPPPDLNPLITDVYSRTNAMWLMELCRLVYRTDKIQPRREEFLERHGLHQIKFFNHDPTQCFLVASEKFAVLAFRGTLGLRDLLSDFEGLPTHWEGEGKIHRGFKEQLDSVWGQVTTELEKLKVPVFYTGHSLGAALATLAAAKRFVESKTPATALYTFGSPRVGTTGFMHAFPPNFLHCRVVNDQDIVPTVPPRPLALGPLLPSYHHVGTLHHIEHDGHLRRGKPNDDEDGVAAPFGQSLKTLGHWIKEFSSVAAMGGAHLVEQFTDHAPINYSARLERAGDLN